MGIESWIDFWLWETTDLLVMMVIDWCMEIKPIELRKLLKKGNQSKKRAFWKRSAHLGRRVVFVVVDHCFTY